MFRTKYRDVLATKSKYQTCNALKNNNNFLGTFYAELSSRISKTASTYTYIYVCIGEIQVRNYIEICSCPCDYK